MRRKRIFGNRDWSDVQSVVANRLRKSFPRANQWDLDDALAGAMLDLVDYWIQLPSSVVDGDPDKTFWQACKRGTWMAKGFLCQEWDDRPVLLESLTNEWSTDWEGEPSTRPQLVD